MAFVWIAFAIQSWFVVVYGKLLVDLQGIQVTVRISTPGTR